MEKRKIRRALRQVAKRNGVSENEVISEIDFAIAQAYENARDSSVIEQWRKIPKAGDMPTAFELLAYLYDRVNQNP